MITQQYLTYEQFLRQQIETQCSCVLLAKHMAGRQPVRPWKLLNNKNVYFEFSGGRAPRNGNEPTLMSGVSGRRRKSSLAGSTKNGSPVISDWALSSGAGWLGFPTRR